jgi:hypothetical protein
MKCQVILYVRFDLAACANKEANRKDMAMTKSVADARQKYKRRRFFRSVVEAALIGAFFVLWNWAQWKWMEHEGLTVGQRSVGLLLGWTIAVVVVVLPILRWIKKGWF